MLSKFGGKKLLDYVGPRLHGPSGMAHSWHQLVRARPHISLDCSRPTPGRADLQALGSCGRDSPHLVLRSTVLEPMGRKCGDELPAVFVH